MCPGGGGGADDYLAAEARARKEIDAILVAACWQVQHQRGMNLGAALGVAVREVTRNPGHGKADDVLFVDRRAVVRMRSAERILRLIASPWCP